MAFKYLPTQIATQQHKALTYVDDSLMFKDTVQEKWLYERKCQGRLSSVEQCLWDPDVPEKQVCAASLTTVSATIWFVWREKENSFMWFWLEVILMLSSVVAV